MENFEDRVAPIANDATTADSRELTGEKYAASQNKIVLIEIETIARSDIACEAFQKVKLTNSPNQSPPSDCFSR